MSPDSNPNTTNNQPQETNTPTPINPNTDSPPQQPTFQTSPTPDPIAMQGATTLKNKLPLKKIILAVALVLVFTAGIGAYAFIAIMNNSPEKVLADAFANTTKEILDRKPLQLTGKITVESTDENSPYKIVVDMDSKQVNNNGEVSTNVQFTYGDALNLTVNANVVTEGTSAVYLKLNNLLETAKQLTGAAPGLEPYVESIRPVLEKIDGKWVKFTEQDASSYGLIESEDEVSTCTAALENLRLGDEDKGKMRDIFSRNQFAIATEELDGEEVNGDKSFHYKLDLNQEAAQSFTKEMIKLESLKQVVADCEITDQVIDDNFKDITKEEAKPVFELWVSKGSRKITKVRVTANDQKVTMDGITTIQIDAPDINVTIPSDFITIQQLSDEINQLLQTGQELNARYNQ